MLHYHISDRKLISRVAFVAALMALAAFFAASIAAPSRAHASACLATACGLPPSERPHGDIGTAEIAYRSQAEGSVAGDVAVQWGSVSFASAVSLIDAPTAFFLGESGRHSGIRLF